MLDKSIIANLEQIKKNSIVVDIETSAYFSDGREINIKTNFEEYVVNAKIKWVGLYSFRDDKFYTLNAKKDTQKILQLLSEHNVIVGFNLTDFDYRILVNNGFIDLDKDYLQVDVMTILGNPNFKNRDGYKFKGRAQLMGYELKGHSLKAIAEVMGLETQKGEIDWHIFQKDEWDENETKEIISYLSKDVLATKEMFLKLWDYWLAFSELLDVRDVYSLAWIRSSIASLTYKSACRIINQEPTFSDNKSEPDNVGGNVFVPTVEEAKSVWYVDFQSLYPHIFCQFNLPAEVNPENVSSKRKLWHGNELFKVKGYYDITEQHRLSSYIADKLKERIYLKEHDKDNPLIYTLKIWLNSYYGCARSAIFEKIYTPNQGTDCCAIGQQIQQFAKEMFEQFCCEIIYGDTDSLMLRVLDEKNDNREFIQDCLNQIVNIIKSFVPFPAETFKINIEHHLDYIMFPFSDEPIEGEDGKNKKENGRLVYQRIGRKKNYCYIFTNDKGEKEVKLVGLPIIKDNATALGMKIYDEVLKPEIIKNMRAKFSASYIQNIINDYLKKPEIIELLSQEYKVKAANSYKNNCIQKQISEAYFGGNEGVIRLVKNSRVGKCGQGTKYATIEEVTNAKLTNDELDLDKVNQELSPFCLWEPPVEATEQPKTATSSLDNAKVDGLPIKKPRGRPKGCKNKEIK
jgi:DNA polymerase elongation subunit (family B)